MGWGEEGNSATIQKKLRINLISSAFKYTKAIN